MATVNRSSHTDARATLRTHEGAVAKRISALAQLRRSVLACLLWEDEFYENGVAIAERIAALVEELPRAAVVDLAIEAREQQHLRHVPLWLLRQLASRKDAGRVVGDGLARVIQRADELTEFLALYWKGGRVPLSAQVKRGLALAFPKFDAYQLGKYNRAGPVRLRDVLFLCHAKPKDDAQAAVWKQLADGTLPAPDTWEVALSTGQDKRATWERLLGENRLGDLALLRNLRNMDDAGVSEAMVREALGRARFARVLPFRFVAAARHAPALEDALEAAMFRAVADLPPLPGRTVLLVDHSGSMEYPLSPRSEITRFDAAGALAILLREIGAEVVVYAYSEDCVRVPARRGFALRDAIHERVNPTRTLLGKAKAKVDAELDQYDRLIVLTDEQSHDTPSAPRGRARGYVVNLASAQHGIGYGQWTHIDGWSESVVHYIQAEEGLPVVGEIVDG